jgi:hypothetical protein
MLRAEARPMDNNHSCIASLGWPNHTRHMEKSHPSSCGRDPGDSLQTPQINIPQAQKVIGGSERRAKGRECKVSEWLEGESPYLCLASIPLAPCQAVLLASLRLHCLMFCGSEFHISRLVSLSR